MSTFEVWDSEYHRGDTSEVVFAGHTRAEADAYIQGATDNGRKQEAYNIQECEDT